MEHLSILVSLCSLILNVTQFFSLRSFKRRMDQITELLIWIDAQISKPQL
jgi:hypothetical protein